MAFTAMAANKYPVKLSNHLRERSEETVDDMLMYMEWHFQGMEDTGEPSSSCPCGKDGIRYLCHIQNEKTHESICVGKRCMLLFDEEMQDVLEFVHGLINTGIRGKYKGISEKTGKYRFEIEESESIVKKSEFLLRHVEFLSVYQKGNGRWEMQVYFDISDSEEPPDLWEECFYHLRMKSSRWEKDYGKGMRTGITFRVIECSQDETE